MLGQVNHQALFQTTIITLPPACLQFGIGNIIPVFGTKITGGIR